MAMSQIMKADPGDFCYLYDPPEITPGDIVGVQRLTVRLAEYQAQVLVGFSGLPLLSVLSFLQNLHGLHQNRRECDRTSSFIGLGRLEDLPPRR